jgi:DNA-binding transcriptional LysR family regulator
LDHSRAFRRLGAVEKRLGAHLFARARTGYAPQPAGEVALATAAQLLDELGALERHLAGEDARSSGTVRVTKTDSLLHLTAPMLAALRVELQEIIIEVVVANPFFTLTKRDADIAIRRVAAVPEALVGRNASPSYIAGNSVRAVRHR